MDYQQLAEQFWQAGHQNFRGGPQRRIDESMRGESFVIFFLSQRHGTTQPSDISAAMGVSTARIASALNALEDKGLVTRRIDPGDRRRILVDLTPAGLQLAQSQRQEMLNHTIRLFEYLGDNDAQEFVRIWGRLAEFTPPDTC